MKLIIIYYFCHIVGDTGKKLSGPNVIYFVIISITTTSMYIALAIMIRQRLRKSAPAMNISMNIVNSSENVTTEEYRISTEQSNACSDNRKSKYLNTQKKLNKMMAAIFIVYYLCYLVLLIPPHVKAFQSNKYFLTTRLVQNLLFGINTIANPFMYLWLNSHFRTAFKSMIRLKVTEPEFTTQTGTGSQTY